MMSNSQESSIKKLLQQTMKELEVLETTLHHRKSELATINQNLLSAKQLNKIEIERIEAETRYLINKKSKETKVILNDLDKQIKEAKINLYTINDRRDQAEKDSLPIIKTIEDSNMRVKELEAIESNLLNEIDKEAKRLEDIKAEAGVISQGILKSVEEQELRTSVISQLKLEEHTLESNIIKLTADFEAKKVKLNDELVKLEAKKRQMIIDEEEYNKRITEELHDIAIRHRLLDDRDANLRRREAKVSEKEGTIIRNSELLNL